MGKAWGGSGYVVKEGGMGRGVEEEEVKAEEGM